jgi:hypothetical protein
MVRGTLTAATVTHWRPILYELLKSTEEASFWPFWCCLCNFRTALLKLSVAQCCRVYAGFSLSTHFRKPGRSKTANGSLSSKTRFRTRSLVSTFRLLITGTRASDIFLHSQGMLLYLFGHRSYTCSDTEAPSARARGPVRGADLVEHALVQPVPRRGPAGHPRAPGLARIGVGFASPF